MTPTEAPEAPVTEQPQAAAASSEAPVVADDSAASAANTQVIDPEVKKLRDRLAEEGRLRKQNEQLALQQAQQIQQLTTQVSDLHNYVTQQQRTDLQNRLNRMTPEDQLAELTKMVLHPPHPAAPPAPQPPTADLAQQRAIAAHLEEINTSLGLEDNPLTAEEVGRHATEAAWLKAAWKQGTAKAKEGAPVPTKPTKKEDAPLTSAEIQKRIDEGIARATGVHRPNAASPAGAPAGGASIADMNRIVNDPTLGPRAKEAALRKLQAG